LTPNTLVPFTDTDGTFYDVNFVSSTENSAPNQLTYAAVTARSYHTGIVNVLLMDGSVRSVSDQIDLTVWRALGTRMGNEVIGDY
jgi:hypothetical protein